MKSFAKAVAVGVTGVVAFKLLVAVFLPLMGLMFGLIAMLVKFALVAAVVFIIYTIFFKKDREEEDELDHEKEIVVEAEAVEVEDDDDD